MSASPAIDAYIRVDGLNEESPAPPLRNRSRSRKSGNSLDGTQKINSTMRNQERILDFRDVQKRASMYINEE
jgi:hypothetical protein